MTPEQCIACAAARHGLEPHELRERSRRDIIVRARHEAMALMRAEGMSLGDIAHVFLMDHSTVLYGLRRHKKRTREHRTRKAVLAREGMLEELHQILGCRPGESITSRARALIAQVGERA